MCGAGGVLLAGGTPPPCMVEEHRVHGAMDTNGAAAVAAEVPTGDTTSAPQQAEIEQSVIAASRFGSKMLQACCCNLFRKLHSEPAFTPLPVRVILVVVVARVWVHIQLNIQEGGEGGCVKEYCARDQQTVLANRNLFYLTS